MEKEGRMALKNRANIKANKAAQLRAIALAEKVETSPLDLWKMKRFTQGATPHISTTTQRRDGREFSSPGGGYGGGNFSGAGNGDVDYFYGCDDRRGKMADIRIGEAGCGWMTEVRWTFRCTGTGTGTTWNEIM